MVYTFALAFAASATALSSSPSQATSPADLQREAAPPEDLGDLVRRQALEIKALNERITALEQSQAKPRTLRSDDDQQQAADHVARTAPHAPARVLPDGVRPTPAANMTALQVQDQIDQTIKARIGSSNPDIIAEWGQGAPIFRSVDGYWSFKLRGRMLLDASTTSGSRYDERNITTTGARALRLGLEGGLGDRFFYQFETDLINRQARILTAFLGYRGGSGKLTYDVRAGNLFNDRGFEGSTGSDSTPFLERNVVATSILPERGFYGMGVQTRLYGSDWHFSVAVTGDDLDGVATASDSRTIQLRGHWNPPVVDGAIVHVGLWSYDENLAGKSVIARDTNIGGRFNDNLRVSTGPLVGATGDRGYGAELGSFVGRFWVMGEAGQRVSRLSDQPDFTARAWSVSGGYFLTGEPAPYNSRNGSFSTPHVKQSIFRGGSGAVALTARYENLDYGNVATGGDGWAATVGGNWYLNDFVALIANGIEWHTDNRSTTFIGRDSGRTFTVRALVVF
ncbi:porin [Sphingomonas bacterium]|uniref:porin n=1 Tax=Sphingomonas bacterium TaxID=1895847 RepID=UPI001576EC58|nr:porin [Sphingomonas bacterium]